MKTKKQDESALPSLALVFGYIAIKDLHEAEDRVLVLHRLGYGMGEIAVICGISKVYVYKIVSSRKKSKRGG